MAHSLLATVGCVVGGFAISFLVACCIALWSSGAGNIVDRTVDSWFFRYCVDNPYFRYPYSLVFALGPLSFDFQSIHRLRGHGCCPAPFFC